jgi:hypothetical protein
MLVEQMKRPPLLYPSTSEWLAALGWLTGWAASEIMFCSQGVGTQRLVTSSNHMQSLNQDKEQCVHPRAVI